LPTRAQEYEVLTREFQTVWTRALLAEMRIQDELREALNSPCMLASEAEQTAWIVKVKSLNNLWTAATVAKRKVSDEFFHEAANYRLEYEDLLEFWKAAVELETYERHIRWAQAEHGIGSVEESTALTNRWKGLARRHAITTKLTTQWEVIQNAQNGSNEGEPTPVSD
jgi:hypothetical protein